MRKNFLLAKKNKATESLFFALSDLVICLSFNQNGVKKKRAFKVSKAMKIAMSIQNIFCLFTYCSY